VQSGFCSLQLAAPDAGAGLLELDGFRFAGRHGDGHVGGFVLHGIALDGQRLAVGRGGERLFLQFRFLHQPVRHAAVEADMRAAALEAARPQPAVIGQDHADAALAETVEDEQRLVVRPVHGDDALGVLDIDGAEPAAPGGGSAWPPSRSRVTGWRRPFSEMRGNSPSR
jgi:hypothetical protein